MFRPLFWLALAGVTVLAVVPTYEPLPEVVSVSDVLNHAAAFLVLYALHALAWPAVRVPVRAGLLLAYGTGIEAVQFFLPARSASFGDIAVDGAALLAAAALHLLVRFAAGQRFQRDSTA